MVQIVRSASCFRPRVRHLPLRIQHRRPVGTVICRFSEWCSAHLFCSASHSERASRCSSSICTGGICQPGVKQIGRIKHLVISIGFLFAGKRHFLFALTNDYVFNFNRHLQPLIITVIFIQYISFQLGNQHQQ